MTSRPFMQLYVSDFAGDTLLLSTEQIGAYLLLLIALWNAGGELPHDEVKLARITRMSVARWRKVSVDLLPFFAVEGGRVSHPRLTKELQKSNEKSASRATAGAKGGAANALKYKAPTAANDQAIAQAELKHLPETRNHIENTAPPRLVAEAIGARDLFDDIFEAFPRNPQSGETAARRAFDRLSGKDPAKLLEAARRYARWCAEDCAARGRTAEAGLHFVPHLSNWITSGAWREAAALPIKAEANQVVTPMLRLDKLRDGALWAECERITGRKAPTSDWSWSFPVTVVDEARAALKRASGAGGQ